ncbi:NAD-dependent epimerase/dehydratase family protein [Candidatus Roizmanbacteria bacterium]|nr:NAD-dependent epimerase/dehydratase family protein [Candidatus Roizmanbacteria bacterium]
MERVKKKVLILGSSGYIGKNLIEGLRQKYKLLTPTHHELELLNSSAVNSYFLHHKIDIVISCAVVGGSRKEEHVENAFMLNSRIFFNIVRNKRHFTRMIHFGSGAEYDKSISLIKIKEKHFDKRVPSDEYGFFKYCCSNQNVYFDYVYIKDFIRIVEYFIERIPKEKFYNIGTGKRIDLLTICKKINTISSKQSKIIVKLRGLNKEYTCNNSRLMNELKSFKFTAFDKALSELYNWYKSRKQLIDKHSL